MGRLGVSWVIFALCACASADIVLQNPRGSNNRLNEDSSNRAQNNRLFDSQNNNKGGYNVGDATDTAFEDEEGQYNMKYFQSDSVGGKSYLHVEWTNQHGCGDINGDGGGAQKRYCEQVLQYMCQDDTDTIEQDTIRNGYDTSRQGFSQVASENAALNSKKDDNVYLERGLHETWDWYKACYLRENNAGLFLADQELTETNMGRTSAKTTRQNPEGDRYGYECPEEKDYWPYWQASPWQDIAVLTSDSSRCSTLQATSQNSELRGRCFQEVLKQGEYQELLSQYIDEASCTDNGGEWTIVSSYVEKATDKTTEADCTGSAGDSGMTYAWRIPYDAEFDTRVEECLVIAPPVDCQLTDFSRMNHQGNTKDGQMMRYKWELPYFPSENTKRCVFRIRYNITTTDYNPYTVNSDDNGNLMTNNPDVDVITDDDSGATLNLQLAVNTAQFGRTFQDRSHVFKMRPREDDMLGKTMYNLNVRGRRGNIVETFPSVEYDFTPSGLSLTTDDLLHIQWTGSNTNPDDAGQGTAQTDRSNFVPVLDPGLSVPVTFDDLDGSVWANVEVVWTYFGKTDITAEDLYVNLASSGYYRCMNAVNCAESEHADYLLSTKTQMNNELNDAYPSYEGVVLRFTNAGDYYFMCTRNNNFSNRAQKGSFSVTAAAKKRRVMPVTLRKKTHWKKKSLLRNPIKKPQIGKRAKMADIMRKWAETTKRMQPVKKVEDEQKSENDVELKKAIKRLLMKLN